jgi:integrase
LALANGRGPEDRLFGRHGREWVRGWVQRICRMAKVPVVSAQSMRGLHSTLAEESGVSAHSVARALGHESITTTHQHYTAPSAVANAKQRHVLRVLDGGLR